MGLYRLAAGLALIDSHDHFRQFTAASISATGPEIQRVRAAAERRIIVVRRRKASQRIPKASMRQRYCLFPFAIKVGVPPNSAQRIAQMPRPPPELCRVGSQTCRGACPPVSPGKKSEMPVVLDPDAAAVYKAFQEAGRPTYETVDHVTARELYLAGRVVSNPQPPELESAKPLSIPAPQGAIPARIYTPKQLRKTGAGRPAWFTSTAAAG